LFLFRDHKRQILRTTSQINSHFSWLRTENSPSAHRAIVGRHRVNRGSHNQIKFSGVRIPFVQICSLQLSRRFFLRKRFIFQAVHMNHSLYSADRQTHRRIVGSAFAAILVITVLGVAAISKFQQQPAHRSIAVLRAGIPVTTTDSGYFIVR
jgi:hypothetical protein